MNIIRSTPNPSGAYPPIQSWNRETLPDGYYRVSCDSTAMQSHGGFVVLTVEGDTVTAMTGDGAAYQAYLAALPPPVPELTEPQELGQEITEEQLERIAMGQEYTDLELAILGGTSHV